MKIQLQLAAAFAALMMTLNPFPSSDGTSGQEPSVAGSETADMALPDEAPMFSAHIEYSPQGYVAKGTFTEFLPDTSLVQPLYSLDGEIWQNCQMIWDLQLLGSETAEKLKCLQTQTCLYGTHEPLAGYLAGQLDRFYLKLQITLESGITYETRTAVIDRGNPQPIPEGFRPEAGFVPDMLIRQWQPFKRYGQYQITVNADATPEDISALLPDTLPISVNLMEGINFATGAVVECPVTWKPLSLSQLAAGERVTIEDAAEELIIPAGTFLNTPNGVFQLKEPLDVENDEIRLILNVIAENAAPTGVLTGYFGGLELSFNLKPTGATAIRAHTLSEGSSTWVEIPDPLLPEDINAPSSAANSPYTLVLKDTSEPYQSYLSKYNAGDEPVPFLVGLTIEGGVYDGQQLILAWPDTYDLPAKLPVLNGAGGNECNAGTDNKSDSTPEGQRPGLPQDPENQQDTQESELSHNPEDGQDAQEQPHNPEDGQDAQGQPHNPEDGQNTQASEPSQFPEDGQNVHNPEPPLTTEHKPGEQQQPKLPPDSFIQVSISETLPILTAGTHPPVSVSVETDTPAWEKADHKTGHRILLSAAAAATTTCIGIAAAAGKVTLSNISRKIWQTLYKLLHLK